MPSHCRSGATETGPIPRTGVYPHAPPRGLEADHEFRAVVVGERAADVEVHGATARRVAQGSPNVHSRVR